VLPRRRVFLRSRIARRIFWVLLLAALLPIGLSALLGYEAFVAREQDQAERRAKEHLKQMGLRLYDRLDAARATLAMHAAAADWQMPEPGGAPDAPGAPAARDLREARGPRPLAHVTTAAAASAPALRWQGPVVHLAYADPAGRGHWLAEIAPEYLWSDFRTEGAGAGLCVVDAAGQPLFCPQGRPPADESTEWRLFMGAGFGAVDWHIVGPRRIEAQGAKELPLARILGLALTATLLVAALLGLVMVRRTLVPLEKLIEGTRRLARGERATRVALPAGDEFGELAASLNGMAEHIERQIHALHVQARIDRGILDGTTLAQTIAQVSARLAEVTAAEVLVIARDIAEPGWLAYRAQALPERVAFDPASFQVRPESLAGSGPLAAIGPAGGEADEADGRREAVGPREVVGLREAVGLRATFEQALGPHARALTWVPATWRGEPVAWLMLGSAQPLVLTGALRQELETLRDRVAIAQAAAAREHHLTERAVRDPLTGLLNRHGLHDLCDRWLDAGEAFGLVFIDLDGFKEVNDTLGHPVGDAVLRIVAERLRGLVPPGGALARMGGDEFVLLLPGGADAAEPLADALCRLVALPIAYASHASHAAHAAEAGEPAGHPPGDLIHLGASAGIAAYPSDAPDRDELLRRADVAMYAAKAAGRGRWRRYADAMDARAAERAWITRELRGALEAHALEVHYQPRFDPRLGRFSSAEALVRWTHAERGPIAPVRFIPVAEETGLVLALGSFVLDTALAQQRRWQDAGSVCKRVAVNVSARQLAEPDFAERTFAALARHGLAPTALELEITESLFAGDATAVQRALAPLRDAGVLVALDDFGTGYSSLAALQSLPIDVLKIDRSFIIDLGRRASAEAVVRSVIALARALHKRVVAEGVETAEQERHLLALGCDEFQGYRYARPLPAAELERQLRDPTRMRGEARLETVQ
jgi:diguanylate cyclase